MDALAAYGSSSASSSSDDEEPASKTRRIGSLDDEEPRSNPLTVPPPRLPSPPLPPPPLPDATSLSPPRPIRQFDHVDGNFATHVYFHAVPDLALQCAIDSSLAVLRTGRGGASVVQTIGHAEYHISLTRTVILRQPQIESFVDAVRKAARGCTATCATTAAGLHELPNDTRTRFFAAVELERRGEPYAALCSLVDALDAVLVRYGAQPFYAERRLHFSVAWSLQPLASKAVAACAMPAGFGVACDAVQCRVGERVTPIKLGS